jgi:hypothetical protein
MIVTSDEVLQKEVDVLVKFFCGLTEVSLSSGTFSKNRQKKAKQHLHHNEISSKLCAKPI